MIISQITGGLGNQLFQFSAGFALAKKLNTTFRLHLKKNIKDTFREPLINKLINDLEWIEDSTAGNYIPSSILKKILNKSLPVNKRSFYSEGSFQFDQNFENISCDTYIKGYWQSEKYFYHYSEIIRDKINFGLNNIYVNPGLLKRIRAQNTISLHIRKGDYLLPPYNNYYHQLDNEYYRSAINLLSSTLDNFKIFVFTDDLNWVKENFNIDMDFEIVSYCQTKNPLEDMRLMSQCNHHIIANSSFSWWTAWLGKKKHCKVIAPSNWFIGEHKISDLIPSEWITV